MPKVSLTKTLLLTAGAAVGALLFAPKSGKETREDLKIEAQRLSRKTKEKTYELKEDFKESYAEAQQELEHERAVADQKQAELGHTIDEIERELEAEQGQNLQTSPESAEDLGDVRGTAQDPEQDQVVPKEELDEALHDNYLSDEEDFDVNEKEVERTTESGDVAGTTQEPNEDQAVPSDELDEALHDNYLSNDEDFDVNEDEIK